MKEGKADYVLRERKVLDALKDDGLVNLCFTFQDPHNLYGKKRLLWLRSAPPRFSLFLRETLFDQNLPKRRSKMMGK